jgi:hypothetical protein
MPKEILAMRTNGLPQNFTILAMRCKWSVRGGDPDILTFLAITARKAQGARRGQKREQGQQCKHEGVCGEKENTDRPWRRVNLSQQTECAQQTS